MDTARKKIIAALVLLLPAVWLLDFAPPAVLLVVVLVVGGFLASYELGALLFPQAHVARAMLMVSSVFLLLLTQTAEAEPVLFGLCVTFITALVVFLFREPDLKQVFPTAALVTSAAVYLGVFAGFIVAMRRFEPALDGTKLVLTHFALAWSNDAGAFFAGRRFGTTKLWPAVSAGKTWAGLYGGIASSILTGLVIAAISPIWRLGDGLVLGVLFGLATPVGDLVESAVKRGAGVKDSGVFMPGHGGVLDRIDSILFTAPIIYFYAVTVGPARLIG